MSDADRPGVPKLGMILPEGEHDMGGRTARGPTTSRWRGRPRSMGFDSLWFVDHLLYGEGRPASRRRACGSAGPCWPGWPR